MSKWSIKSKSSNIPPACGFLEGTRILCLDKDGNETYCQIQEIRPGTSVKTFHNGYLPVKQIGTKKVFHNPKTSPKLYICKRKDYQGKLLEDFVLLDTQYLLVDEKQEDDTTTDSKYKQMSRLDKRHIPYETKGTFSIWQFSLEDIDPKKTFGIFANGGLLVESSSQYYLTNHSGMVMV